MSPGGTVVTIGRRQTRLMGRGRGAGQEDSRWWILENPNRLKGTQGHRQTGKVVPTWFVTAFDFRQEGIMRAITGVNNLYYYRMFQNLVLESDHQG